MSRRPFPALRYVLTDPGNEDRAVDAFRIVEDANSLAFVRVDLDYQGVEHPRPLCTVKFTPGDAWGRSEALARLHAYAGKEHRVTITAEEIEA